MKKIPCELQPAFAGVLVLLHSAGPKDLLLPVLCIYTEVTVLPQKGEKDCFVNRD